MSDQTHQPPIKTFWSGPISASIWRNEVDDGQGNIRVQYKTRIQKRFKDPKTNKWVEGQYYFPEELSRLSAVARRAYDFIMVHERDPQASTAFPPEQAEDADAPVEEEPATEA